MVGGRGALGAIVVLLVLSSACAQQQSGSGQAPPPAAPAPSEPATAAPEEPSEEPSLASEEPTEERSEASEEPGSEEPEVGQVSAGDSDLGEILVEDEDITLYAFTNDTANESACYDACAQTWPPFIVEGAASAGDGGDEALVDTTERRDGSTQVTYNGQPLYYYSGDAAPGETNGQGVGGVWFVVSPEGELIRSAAG